MSGPREFDEYDGDETTIYYRDDEQVVIMNDVDAAIELEEQEEEVENVG